MAARKSPAPANPPPPASAWAYRSWIEYLQSTATPERLIAVTQRAWEQAAAGDYRARDWLGKYLLPERVQIAVADTSGVVVEFVRDSNATKDPPMPPPAKPEGGAA